MPINLNDQTCKYIHVQTDIDIAALYVKLSITQFFPHESNGIHFREIHVQAAVDNIKKFLYGFVILC